jgi:general stress protein YciG
MATKHKNPAAVALGRLGGKKGGRARMASMSPEERSEFARQGGKVSAKGRKRKLTSEQRSAIARKAGLAGGRGRKKNAAAVELERREIARKAAEARWGDVKAMAKEVVAAYDAGQADKRRRRKP